MCGVKKRKEREKYSSDFFLKSPTLNFKELSKSKKNKSFERKIRDSVFEKLRVLRNKKIKSFEKKMRKKKQILRISCSEHTL